MNDTAHFLSSKKVRPTAMRILALQFLVRKKIAVSLTEMESFFEQVDRTTLYRTLKTFLEKGIVHQINDAQGIPKYALCQDGCNFELHNDLHLHFHCTYCKETQCLTEHKIPQISLPNDYSVRDMDLIVNGLCNKCTSIA